MRRSHTHISELHPKQVFNPVQIVTLRQQPLSEQGAVISETATSDIGNMQAIKICYYIDLGVTQQLEKVLIHTAMPLAALYLGNLLGLRSSQAVQVGPENSQS